MNEPGSAQAAVPAVSVRGGRTFLTYPVLDSPWFVHGTVILRPGVPGALRSPGPGAVVSLMRRSINPEPRLVVVPHQTHGSRIYVVEPAGVWEGRPGASSFPDCDGLVTSAGGVVIGVSSADCIPLFAFDDASGTLGIAHCGWRGIAAGIVEAMVASLEGAGAGRSGTRFLIGVSIGSCCYEVGHELLGAFSVSEVDECVGKARSEGERRMFDLKKLVARRLAEQGIDRDAVFTDNTCTSCRRDLLCSYRAHGSACGRMYSYLMKRVGER